METATFILMLVGMAIAIMGSIWTLFGMFRSDRLLGWTYLLVPGPCKICPALAWAFLYWEEARRPLAYQLVGLALMFAGGGF